jgi:putative methyltransferase
MMGNEGEVHAFDVDAARARELEANLARLGASCAVARHGNFIIEADPTLPRWLDVEFIQLDPSCSGSGTTFHHRRDADISDLVSAQFSLLAHAGRFPGARRIVYSTCSTDEEENEAVVAKAVLLLGTIGWALTHALPAWPRRGKAVAGLAAADAERCARFDPNEDLCLGFFVAVFERGPRRLELG